MKESLNLKTCESKENNMQSLMGFSMPTFQSFQELRVQTSNGLEKHESPAFYETKPSFYSTKTGLP